MDGLNKNLPAGSHTAVVDTRLHVMVDVDHRPEAEPVVMTIPGNRLPTSTDASVGNRIRELRRAAGRTQKELADTVGVTGAQFHRYERGTTRIATSRLLDIATALGVRLEMLVGTAAPRNEPMFDIDDGATDELVELVQVFSTINDPRRRSALMAFARAIARGQPLPTGDQPTE